MDIIPMMRQNNWQLKLVHKSLKKKEKIALINKNLEVKPDHSLLDLGCAQGSLSYFLRKKGGFWVSADQDFTNVQSSRNVLVKNLIQLEPGPLPFHSQSFDKVVCLDYLEHLENDQMCVDEIHRVLKKGGEFIAATPRIGHVFVLNYLRPLLGMKLEFYGHKRAGYSLKHLKTLLKKADFLYIKHKSFSGFLTEFIELILNYLYIKLFSSKQSPQLRDGNIRPSTSTEFRSSQKAFHFYSWIYPVIWLISKIDKIFFFQRGYGIMVWAKKE
jgi:2-polyprenyl-3-methyl-5-hydroxy-6-metoxy-1,4-benzoquinol methylase